MRKLFYWCVWAIFIGTAAALSVLSSCKFGLHEMFWRPNPVDQRSTFFEKIPAPIGLTSSYDCLILTDVHVGNEKYTFPKQALLNKLDELNSMGKLPKMCIILGDSADHGTAAEFEEFAAFQQAIRDKGIPVYNVVGNHDLYNSGWPLWKASCTPYTSTYYFEASGFEWYFLDTGSGTLGRAQFYDLKRKLRSSPKPKLLFTHYPIYGNGIFYFALSNPRERAELLALFARTNVKLYCAGHYHPSAYYDYGPFQEHVLKAFGLFAHYHIMHIDGTNQTYTIQSFSLK